MGDAAQILGVHITTVRESPGARHNCVERMEGIVMGAQHPSGNTRTSRTDSTHSERCSCCGAEFELEPSIIVALTTATWPLALIAAGAVMVVGGLLDFSPREVAVFLLPAVAGCLFQWRRYLECSACGMRVPEGGAHPEEQ